MRRGIFAGIGMTFALGGCILIDTYQSDTYKPQETSSASSSSTSTGMGGAGGLAGQGGATSQGGNGGMAGMGGVVEPPGTVEICGNDIDEDGMAGIGGMGGFGTVEAVCPQIKASWNARFGDQTMQRVRRVGFTNTGDIVIAGEYDGMITLGAGMNQSVADDTDANHYQAFVARLSSDGTPKWIVNDGPMNEGSAVDFVATDISGDTYWVGHRADRAKAAKIPAVPGSGWSTPAFNGAPGSRAAAIAYSPAAAMLYVAGTVTGTGTFDCTEAPQPAYDNVTTPQLFLAAINPSNGACVWAEIYPAADIDPESVTMKLSGGNPIIAGTYRVPITGIDWPVVPNGGSGIFFIEASPANGTITKSRGYATAEAGEINVRRLQTFNTAKGNVFVTGSFRGKFATNLGAADPASTSADTTLDAFVMSVNSASKFDVQWINRFGGPKIQEGTGIAAGNMNLYATGITYGPMSPDPATAKGQMCNPNEGKCMYWIKMSAETGTIAWAQSIGSMDFSANPTIDVAANNNNTILGGGWSQPIDFGNTPIKPSAGNLDIFVASYTAASLP